MNLRTAWCLLLVGLVAIGCGDDDGSNMEAVDGGPRAGASGAKSGGASGRANGGTGGSAGGTATVQPVPCGDTMCQPPQSPFAAFAGFLPPGILPMPAPCCLDEDAEMCGVALMAGGACEAPATRDERCAGINLMIPGIAGGDALGGLGFGCCTEMDQCGIDGSIAGLGCVENSMAASQLGPIASFLMLPAPKGCDAPLPMAGAGGTGGDAGVDAGVDGGASGTGGDEDAGSP